MGKLNAAKVKALTAPGTYGDGGGLYLHVKDAARRSWLFRYRSPAGKHRWMGLGTLRDVPLADARQAAVAARAIVRQGGDPIEQRDARRAEAIHQAGRNTFQAIAEAYIAAHAPAWRNAKHAAQWTSTLTTYAYPVIGRMPVGAIGTAEVTAVLDPIWTTKPETASRVRGRIEAVLDYATARGLRTGDNPARWRGHLANLLPARGKVARVEHHAALPWRQIGSFMAMLAAQEGVAALALRFLILTAARTGEAIGARWGEIDTAQKVWTVPGTRMKAGREHRVPLSDPALAILRQLAATGTAPGAFIFPGQRTGHPLSNMALTALLRRMKRGEITVHGFRSSFRDWCAEATNTPRELAEAALAHTLRDKVEAAYQRGDFLDRRRHLMADWAEWCSRPAREDNVVAIKSAAVG
ncbi:tyrosine-type recombinase/integrase [Acidisphaera rubrifaciens]|uniref:Phage integrase n=1 Tax=Acidisphaera rubrifaciens HS-AP3 TaxID=1231350 RepID=A0A0D6P5X2_9PROT|nr:site-specific integrase [Acidisphaera rubrifaciens]GAN76274.1 phage integrase [Acidisphaera rubrifaciens HS-AP3]